MLYLFLGIVLMCSQVWGWELAPEPPTALHVPYTIQVVTCVPGPGSVPHLQIKQSSIQFAPGRFLPHSGAHIRCAIPLTGTAYWNSIRVLYKDYDGFHTNASVLLTLYRAQFGYTTAELAHIDSSNYPRTPYAAGIAQAPILVPEFDFAHFAYWVDIILFKRTEVTVSPVVYAVELRYYASYDPYTAR